MLDWKAVNLKAGVEIHQQLDTGKLFCGCSSEMRGEPELMRVFRKQHPVPSELGRYDVSALYEELRDRRFFYDVVEGESCLVELDEEPPHSLNRQALEAALLIAYHFHSNVFDEFHVMRKTITDGSNTGAFQRTIMISEGGYVEAPTPEGLLRVPLEGINLEEDAANITWKKGEDVGYGLSRLGIPLVEIGTEVIEASPQAVAEVAKGIGLTLRSTRKVKRGLGTIRQDVNVSVKGGKRVEIKGVQDLRNMPAIIEAEALRQLALIELAKAGLSDGVSRVGPVIRVKGAWPYLTMDLHTGTLRDEIESSARAYMVDVKFDREGDDLLISMGASSEGAEGVDRPTRLEKRWHEVENRVRSLFSGPSEETRAVVSGSVTAFTRPLPGGARMYPETDLSPIPNPRLEFGPPPKPYYEELAEIRSTFSLDESASEELYTSPYLDVARRVISGTSLSPSYVASVLLGTVRSLGRQGIDVVSLSEWQLYEVMKLVDEGFPKEGVEGLLAEVARRKPGDAASLRDIASSMIGERVDLEGVIRDVLQSDAELIRRKGEAAYAPLMGDVMKRVRGKVDGKKVAEALKRALKDYLEAHEGNV